MYLAMSASQFPVLISSLFSFNFSFASLKFDAVLSIASGSPAFSNG